MAVSLFLHSFLCQENSDGFAAGDDEVYTLTHTTLLRASGTIKNITTISPNGSVNWNAPDNSVQNPKSALATPLNLEPGDIVAHLVTLWEQNDTSLCKAISQKLTQCQTQPFPSAHTLEKLPLPEKLSRMTTQFAPQQNIIECITELLTRSDLLLGSFTIAYGIVDGRISYTHSEGPHTLYINEPAEKNNFLMRCTLENKFNYLFRFAIR